MKIGSGVCVLALLLFVNFPSSRGSAPTNGLIAHWTFDEENFASGVHDETGLHNGTAVNATRVAGKVGAGALSLNGSNAYVFVGGVGTALQLTNTAYTIAWWQKWGGATSTHQNVYAMDDGADYSAGYSTYLFQGGGALVVVHNDGATQGWFGPATTDQNWHHYAITYSGNQQRLYVDGVFLKSRTVSGPVLGEDDPFVIGGLRLQNGTFVNFFKGIIDDFQIYGRALTDQEVAALLIPPLVSLEPLANYPLDGNAIDISGNGLNGAAIASPSTNRFGAFQSAMEFNGASDVINCGTPTAFNFSSSFTLSAWVKLNGFQSAKYIVAKYNGNSSPGGYGLATDFGTARAYAFVSSSTGSYIECSGGASLNDSRWHLLNFVYDNAFGIRLYVDGALVGSQAAIGYAPFNSPSIPLTIGGLTNSQFFGGQIDDVKIYGRALPVDEVQSRFGAEKDGLVARYDLNGNAQDMSGNGLHGTITGTTGVADRFGVPNGAVSFGGTNDYIDLGNRPEFNFTRNFTLLAWAKASGIQSAEYVLAKYFDVGGGSRVPRSYGLGIDDSARGYGFISNDSPGYTDVAGGVSMNDGNWHAIAMSYNADSGLSLYEDGVLVGARAVNGFPAFTNSLPLMIGRASSGQSFNGAIDDVRIYAKSLSAPEIGQIYQTEFGAAISISLAVKLQFPTIIGKSYQLQSSTNLATWAQLGNAFTATENTSNRYVDAASDDEFYRLQVAP